MSLENKLRNKLQKTQNIKDNREAVKQTFQAFGEYYGGKADESRNKANIYLGLALFLFFILIVGMTASL